MIPLQSLTVVVHHLPIPVVVTDAEGYVVGANALASSVLRASPQDDRLQLDGHLEALGSSRPTAERSPIVCDGDPYDLVVLGQTGRASQPDAAAQGAAALAGEVAHDFNNLLGVIINYATLAATDAPDGSQQSRDLAEVLAASRRAAEIADRLRRMSVAGSLD